MALCHLGSTIYDLEFKGCHLVFDFLTVWVEGCELACSLNSIIYYLLSIIYYLLSIIYYLTSII